MGLWNTHESFQFDQKGFVIILESSAVEVPNWMKPTNLQGLLKSDTQFHLFLAYLYCQKQLKMKILIRNEIIFTLKSVLKECCALK